VSELRRSSHRARLGSASGPPLQPRGAASSRTSRPTSPWRRSRGGCSSRTTPFGRRSASITASSVPRRGATRCSARRRSVCSADSPTYGSIASSVS
jgi:hypothetical protein